MATNSIAQNAYDFVESGTNDILASLELSNLPATVNDIVAFSFSAEGDAIFNPVSGGILQPAFFVGNGSVSNFGLAGLRSADFISDVTWTQDVFIVGFPMDEFTYHFSLNFFPFSPPFQPSSLEMTGDATASTIGRWLPSPEIYDPGDYNHDGDINGLDYSVWQSSFGSTTNLDADGNDNGVVDAADYTVWRDNLGTGTTVSVPEPGAAALLLASLWCCLQPSRQSLSDVIPSLAMSLTNQKKLNAEKSSHHDTPK